MPDDDDDWAYILPEDEEVVEVDDLLVKAVARVEGLAEDEEPADGMDCFRCFRPATADACARRSLTALFEDLLNVGIVRPFVPAVLSGKLGEERESGRKE
jgi:hypothetical protein